MAIALPDELKIPFELWYQDIATDFPTIRVSNAHASATIALHGAQVIDYIPKDQEPVLYTSPLTFLQEGKAIRGGIPVCWPWFSAHPTNPNLPSHGVARTRFWELAQTTSEQEYTEMVFTLNTSAIGELTFDCSVTLTIRVGKKLELHLTTKNLGSENLTIGGALHSYFQVSNIRSVRISGLDETSFIDTTTNTNQTQEGDIIINSEVDNIYTNTSDTVIIHDEGFQREIHIHKKGSNSSVIWNPWQQKSQAMQDLPDEDYQDFLCVETANAREDVYVLTNNQEHTLTTVIEAVKI